MPTRKEQDAHRIIDRYTLTGCPTVDDWNLYAGACKVLGLVPMVDPCFEPTPINGIPEGPGGPRTEWGQR